MKLSREVFGRVVWPVLRRDCPYFRDGQLISLEGLPQRAAQVMDMVGGIDALVMCGDGMTMVQLACRVQYGVDYRSHTLRLCRGSQRPVEWQRGLYRRLNGTSGPDFTVQAYVRDRSLQTSLMSCGVVKTTEYFDHVRGMLREGRQLRIRAAVDAGDGSRAWFAVLYWPIGVPSFWKWVNRGPQQVFGFCD